MEKDLMPTAPQLIERSVRNSVVETALIGMSKNDRYPHRAVTLNDAAKGPQPGGHPNNERGRLDLTGLVKHLSYQFGYVFCNIRFHNKSLELCGSARGNFFCEARAYYYRNARSNSSDFFGHIGPGHTGHATIGDDQIEPVGIGAKQFQSLQTACCGSNLIPQSL